MATGIVNHLWAFFSTLGRNGRPIEGPFRSRGVDMPARPGLVFEDSFRLGGAARRPEIGAAPASHFQLPCRQTEAIADAVGLAPALNLNMRRATAAPRFCSCAAILQRLPRRPETDQRRSMNVTR